LEQNQTKMIIDLKSFIIRLTMLMPTISGLSFLVFFLGMVKSTISIQDILRLLLWWYIATPIYLMILGFFEKRLKIAFVKQLGIPLYLFVFGWQLAILILF